MPSAYNAVLSYESGGDAFTVNHTFEKVSPKGVWTIEKFLRSLAKSITIIVHAAAPVLHHRYRIFRDQIVPSQKSECIVAALLET
jgi:hypothetical protein